MSNQHSTTFLAFGDFHNRWEYEIKAIESAGSIPATSPIWFSKSEMPRHYALKRTWLRSTNPTGIAQWKCTRPLKPGNLISLLYFMGGNRDHMKCSESPP